MAKRQNVGAIERATRREWSDWVASIDALGGRDLPHEEIVPLVRDAISNAELKNHGWWAQGITIAYEQHIGRRIPGQQSDGTFACNASKTLPGTLDGALAAWVDSVENHTRFNGVEVTDPPSTSATTAWRYWRCVLEDGSRVNVTVNAATNGKSRIAVQHGRLNSPEAATEWKTYWKAHLAGV